MKYPKTLLAIIFFLSYFLMNGSNSNLGDYAERTITIKVLDAEDEEKIIKNIKVHEEMYLEYVECAEFGIYSPERLASYKEASESKDGSEENRLKWKKNYEDLYDEIEEMKRQNNIPIRDTFLFEESGLLTHSVMATFMSYDYEFIHPGYDTLHLSKKFDSCQHDGIVIAKMNKRK